MTRTRGDVATACASTSARRSGSERVRTVRLRAAASPTRARAAGAISRAVRAEAPARRAPHATYASAVQASGSGGSSGAAPVAARWAPVATSRPREREPARHDARLAGRPLVLAALAPCERRLRPASR